MDEVEVLVKERVRQGKVIKEVANKVELEQQDNSQGGTRAQLKALRMKARQDEKSRIEKQNWILNILKNIKMLSTCRKRQYYDSSLNIMRHLVPDFNDHRQLTEQELNNQFTEQFINLYANFFESGREELRQSIRHIIRPNNVNFGRLKQRTVITDLVKQLVIATRDMFKQTIVQTQMYNREESMVERYLPSVESANLVGSVILSRQNGEGGNGNRLESNGSVRLESKSLPPVIPRKPVQTTQLLSLQDPTIFNHPNNLLLLRHLPDKQKQQQAISLYLKLKDRNHRLKLRLQCWRSHIFGTKKSLHYDFHNLYTKQQMEQLENEKILTPRKLLTGSYKEPEMRNFLKAYMAVEARRQRKPRPLRIHDQYRHYLVLCYDHRYPLELMVNGRRVGSPDKDKDGGLEARLERNMSEKIIKRLDGKSPRRRSKGNFMKEVEMAESNLIAKEKVTKQGFLPDVNVKTTSLIKQPSQIQTKRQIMHRTNQSRSTQTQFFTSRSARIIKFEQSNKKDAKNFKAFTRSKNLDQMNNGTLELLKFIRQCKEVKDKPL